MLFKPIPSINRKRHAAFIYAVVFGSRYSVLLVLILFASFLVQPVHQAYANEATSENSTELSELPVTAADVAIQESSPIIEATILDDTSKQLPELVASENLSIIPPVSSDTVVEPAENSEEILDYPVADNETTSASDHISTPATATSAESIGSNEPLTTADTQNASNNASNSEVVGVGMSDDSVPDDINFDVEPTDNLSGTTSSSTLSDDDKMDSGSVVEDDTSSSSVTIVENPVVSLADTQNSLTEDNFYQFNRQSCVAIGDGTYHCSNKTESDVDRQATVYADLGTAGNMEIFLRTSQGEVRQLTDNQYDDTSPDFDAEAMQVVWQRLVDDRYQVVSYDVEAEKESQLTYSRTNNMEPKVSKDGIVWQSWDGHDWEVMYFDGKYTDQLTDNQSQDVAPAISDGYVLWSVLGESEQEAKVYSLASGETLNINGYEGGMITNPRFVLVYDTNFDNGDVVTQGFDPTTGLSAPLAAKPAEDPVDIPDTDATGEIRALIQNKSSQKSNFNTDGTKDNIGSSTPNVASSTAASGGDISDTLDLTQASSTNSTTSMSASNDAGVTAKATSPESVLELTDYDLILITPPGTTTPPTEASTTPSD